MGRISADGMCHRGRFAIHGCLMTAQIAKGHIYVSAKNTGAFRIIQQHDMKIDR